MPRLKFLARAAAVAGLAAAAVLPAAATASAHGFSSTVYATITSPTAGVVRAQVSLEYDLLVVSAAENEKAPKLFDDGMAVFQTGHELTAVTQYLDVIAAYAGKRLTVTSDGQACTPALAAGVQPDLQIRDDVPYAIVTLDYTCPPHEGRTAPAHEVTSALFPDTEGYVTGTVTVVQYDLDDHSGSAALKADQPSFSTGQTTGERFREFFLLGAEHLLTGIDHILFLLALIVGSRRLRDVVLAATSFTVAHSVTFILAALGLVTAPARVVEPVIAASIAVVAAWHLWNLRRRAALPDGGTVAAADVRGGRLGLDRADWTRLAVVFSFGLVHGLGFASALGIDEAFSWRLLWSLLVFNVGIEAVQISIIVVVFPLLLLLRRRAPRVGTWVGAVVAAGVAVMGLIWFVQRVLGG